MEEKKIVTISENNIFHKHRHEIAQLSKEKNVDLGVAVSMICHEKGWGKECDKDKKEFTEYLSYITRQSKEHDSEIKKYFNEG